MQSPQKYERPQSVSDLIASLIGGVQKSSISNVAQLYTDTNPAEASRITQNWRSMVNNQDIISGIPVAEWARIIQDQQRAHSLGSKSGFLGR